MDFSPWKSGTTALVSSIHIDEKTDDKLKKAKDDKKIVSKAKDLKEKEKETVPSSDSLAELPTSLAIIGCLPPPYVNSLSNAAFQIQLNIDKAFSNIDSLSRTCVALAEIYGKLSPFETSRALFLAQMADIQALGIDFFVKTSSFDNFER